MPVSRPSNPPSNDRPLARHPSSSEWANYLDVGVSERPGSCVLSSLEEVSS